MKDPRDVILEPVVSEKSSLLTPSVTTGASVHFASSDKASRGKIILTEFHEETEIKRVFVIFSAALFCVLKFNLQNLISFMKVRS